MGGDLLALLAAILLLGANAFFVGAEFSLISARRDRLEALQKAGDNRASTVLRAAGELSRMLAGAQLGITISSLLLGRLGEPAVAHLIERPMTLLGIPDAFHSPISFTLALGIVVVAHMVLGEMVPKNIAIARPERAALILVPVHVAFVRLTSPLNFVFNLVANGVLRLFRVQPRDDLDTSYTTGELADMVAESQREGLLDLQESSRLTRTLRSSEATVAEVLIPLERLRALPAEPTVSDVADAVASSGFSRFPLRTEGGELLGYLHIKDILDLAGDPGARVPRDRIRLLPEIPLDARIDVALAALRRARAHLGRAVDGSGATVGLVTLEDLVESYVGMIRDATHR